MSKRRAADIAQIAGRGEFHVAPCCLAPGRAEPTACIGDVGQVIEVRRPLGQRVTAGEGLGDLAAVQIDRTVEIQLPATAASALRHPERESTPPVTNVRSGGEARAADQIRLMLVHHVTEALAETDRPFRCSALLPRRSRGGLPGSAGSRRGAPPDLRAGSPVRIGRTR